MVIFPVTSMYTTQDLKIKKKKILILHIYVHFCDWTIPAKKSHFTNGKISERFKDSYKVKQPDTACLSGQCFPQKDLTKRSSRYLSALELKGSTAGGFLLLLRPHPLIESLPSLADPFQQK